MAAASPRDPEEVFARMILEAHGEALRRYLGRHGMLPDDLEDALQDVARVASKAREVYDPARPVRAWLRGIARNVLRHYERRRARGLRLSPSDDVAAITDVRPNPEETLIQRDRLLMLARMLGSMSEIQRRVFVQHKLNEIPMPAVAEAEGLSIDTAWMHCKNAEARCRAWFHRWQAAERAKGRDGRPIVFLPLFDAMESVHRESDRSRFGALAGRIFMRTAATLLALGCMSPGSREEPTLEPIARVDAVALSAATPSDSAPESRSALAAALPGTRRPEATPKRAPGAKGATMDLEDDDVEIMLLQAEVEHSAGNDAEAIRLLMDHSERSSARKSESKRNKLLREIKSR